MLWIIIIVVIALFVIITFNSLVVKRNQVKNGWYRLTSN